MKENQQAIELIERLFNATSFYRYGNAFIDPHWADSDWTREEVWRDAKSFLAQNKLSKRQARLKEFVSVATTPNYFPKSGDKSFHVLMHSINCAIEANGFETQNFSDICASDSGMQSFNLSEKTFLCVSWYKMPSGSFEIVAYTS